MRLVEAEALLKDSANYELAYRVDSASTADIFVRYRQHTLYLGHFLDGECISVEKRAIVSRESMEEMFAAYSEVMGPPGKGSESRDGQLHYSRWSWRDRELELSANSRSDGGFLLIHQEYSPQLRRDAVLRQQQELRDNPPVLDPLSGLPLDNIRTASERALAANQASPGDPVWEEAAPEGDSEAVSPDGSTAAEAPPDETTQKKDAEQPRPRITGKNDWD